MGRSCWLRQGAGRERCPLTEGELENSVQVDSGVLSETRLREAEAFEGELVEREARGTQISMLRNQDMALADLCQRPIAVVTE